MINKAIDNMVSIWDGRYMGVNFIDGVEAYLYLQEGPKMFVVNFDIDERWNDNIDVVISKPVMKTMIKMEDLFSVNVIIAVNYTDRQSWVSVMDVYTRIKARKTDMIHKDSIYIPKEMFKLLIKAAVADVTE